MARFVKPHPTNGNQPNENSSQLLKLLKPFFKMISQE